MMLITKIFRTISNLPARINHYSPFQCEQLMGRRNQLREMLLMQIENQLELPIPQYWNQCLTHPEFGYYSNQNVFSKEGDFITSPEISPLFGQMLGVWIVQFLQHTKILSPNSEVEKKFRIIELGGGRGLLMRDILKVFHQLKLTNYFDVCMVQISEYNRKCQQETILDRFKHYDQYFRFEHETSTVEHQFFTSEDKFKDINLHWFRSLEALVHNDAEKKKNTEEDAPFTIFVMNEYFDALPVRVLEHIGEGKWKEQVLRRSGKNGMFFQLGLSDQLFPEKMSPNIPGARVGHRIEVSTDSLLQVDLMSKVINLSGGCIINVDYGGAGSYDDSIRAIKNHKYVPGPYFWQIPGECDLSAYVNFSALADFATKNKGIREFELLPQGYFLQAMGIVPRIEILKKKMDDSQKSRLESEYNRLVHPDEMGEIYKIQILTKQQYGPIYPYIQQDPYSF